MRIVGQGHMDLIEDFAFRLPVTIICDMLGIPEDHREVFYKSSRDGGRLLDPVPLSPAEIEQGNAGNADGRRCISSNCSSCAGAARATI